MWSEARPIREYWAKKEKEGVRFSEAKSELEFVDREMAAYGDWTLYRDKDGNLWEEYFSIGD